MQYGDVFGPWIWTDLRNSLNLLTRLIVGAQANYASSPTSSSYVPSPYSASGDPGTMSYSVVNVVSDSPADAMAAADALWPPTPSVISSALPLLFAQYGYAPAFSEYTAQIRADVCQFGSTGIYAGRAAALDTYLLAETFGNTFNANGTGLTSGVWNLFDSTALAGTGGDVFTEALCGTVFGSGVQPAWPAIVGSANSTGMAVASLLQLVRWDVSGGFAFTSSTP
jgi:hypothetical protein